MLSYSAEQEIHVGKFLLRESYVHVTTEADVAYESTSPKTGCMMLSLRLCYGAETCTYATYIFVNFVPRSYDHVTEVMGLLTPAKFH